MSLTPYKRIGMVLYDDKFEIDFKSSNRDFNPTQFKNLSDVFRSSGKNLGNNVFVYSALKIFNYDQIIRISKNSIKNKDMDVIVLLLANIIRNTNHNEKIAGSLYNLLKDTDIPIIVMSIGAQNDNKEYIPNFGSNCVKLMKLLSEKTDLIGVRGEYTRKVFAKYSIENTIELGCPSIFLNGNKNLGKILESKYKDNIESIGLSLPSNYYDNLSQKIYKIVMNRPNNKIFLQSGDDLIKIVIGINSNFSSLYEKMIRKKNNMQIMKYFFDNKIEFYNEIPDWYYNLTKHTHFVAPRIHGSIMAISSEIPTVCIAIDSRIEELCILLQIPYIKSDYFLKTNSNELWKNIEFNGKAFDENRKNLAKIYVLMLELNNIEPSEHILNFLN